MKNGAAFICYVNMVFHIKEDSIDNPGYFKHHTRLALTAETEDHVSKDTDEYELIEQLKRDNGLKQV